MFSRMRYSAIEFDKLSTQKTRSMKRLFFALWPKQSTLPQCIDLLAKLHSCRRPTPLENLHVTLVFLGNVDAERQRALTIAAKKIRFSSMNLKFDRLEFWRKPGVLCLTNSEPSAVILELNQQLASIAQSYQIPIDEHPFKPHVTLAKKAIGPVAIDFEPIFWPADTFCLAESVSTPNGVRYKVLETWPCPTQTGDQPCPS